jgi:hypothetical protein
VIAKRTAAMPRVVHRSDGRDIEMFGERVRDGPDKALDESGAIRRDSRSPPEFGLGPRTSDPKRRVYRGSTWLWLGSVLDAGNVTEERGVSHWLIIDNRESHHRKRRSRAEHDRICMSVT